MTYPQRTKLKTRLTLQKLCKDPQPALWGLKRNTVLLKGWVSIDFAYISKIKIFFFIFLNLLVSQSITWEKQRNEIVLALGVGFQFSSVQFSRSVVSDSLRPHESQHARPPCPSPTPGVHSDSHPSSQWWIHPAISFSVVLFSSCSQSLPASESFPMSQLFLHMRWPKYWSFSFSISPSNEHSGLISFRMEWLDLLAVHETLKSLLQHHSSKASIVVWRKGNPLTLLVGMQTSTATMENSVEIP